MKRLILLLAIVTVAAACSSSDDSSEATSTSAAVSTAQSPAENPTSSGDITSDSIGDDGASLVPDQTIAPEGPAAPDFTMALANGDSFTLSEQAMPVYMIFWADW
jgi:ABC-type glycerol-3-phosphate transport system substrate-binding protein